MSSLQPMDLSECLVSSPWTSAIDQSLAAFQKLFGESQILLAKLTEAFSCFIVCIAKDYESMHEISDLCCETLTFNTKP